MKIIIAGAGEVGTHLAKMLSQEKQDIILMDPNEERLNFTNSSMEILPMVGNPTSIRDLEEAGIRKADLFVSVTPEETTNVAASILASKLGAHKTLARINNYEYLLPKNKELFEKMGIDTLKIARKVHKDFESKSLGALCDYYHIENPAAHRAYYDALATAKLYQTLAHYFEPQDPKVFQPLQLQYKIKKVQPATPKQIALLERLTEQKELIPDWDAATLTRSEASRIIDRLLKS